MASSGSTELNRETGSKQHLQPLDAFLGCLCLGMSAVGAPPRWGSLQHSIRPSSLLPPFQEPLCRFWPSASNFTISS